MNNALQVITRYGEPSKLDTANFLTLCKIPQDNLYKYYIQTSHDSENPKWEELGVFSDKQEDSLIKLINLKK